MQILEATSKGDVVQVQQLVNAGGKIGVTDDQELTPLWWAEFGGHMDMIRFLVDDGAVVDTQDNGRMTPLIVAAYGGDLDVVRFLVEHGALVDTQNNDGETPLIHAAENSHLDVVRFLVEHGALVNTQDNDGKTPLIVAAYGGHMDVVRFLVEHGALVDIHNNDGNTPLIVAAYCGHLDMVRFLVEHRALVDTHDKLGTTPLTKAAYCGHLDVVRFLVEHGATVNTQDNDGRTPLWWAAYGGHLDVVRFLVEHEVVMDIHDNYGNTPLIVAAYGGHLDVVRFLVKLETNSSLKSTDCNAALSMATKLDRQEVAQFLLPLVRYQNRRIHTEYTDEHVTRHSNIPSSWLIAPFELEVEPFINAGNIGGDYRGKWLDADVVVKLFVDGATSATFVDEVRLWHRLRHPNILKLYGVCNSHHRLFICEYASKGSLPEYLKLCDTEHRTPWKFLYEAALGLEYLHERKIVHGNLRGSNILIGNDELSKLSGFRLSTPSSEEKWYASGDWVRWAAPESLWGEQVSIASDVYSFGMCIMEAVSGHVPFYGYDELYVKTYKDELIYDMPTTNVLCKLVLAMCNGDPSKRLQIPTVVNKLEWFAKIEAEIFTQHTGPESLVAFDEFDYGKTSSLWNAVRALVVNSENDLYRQIYHDLELIYDTLKSENHTWSTQQRFHDLLVECKYALGAMSQQSQVRRLSATRARDYSVKGLHRRINQLLQLVRPHEHDAETRVTEWERLCREKIEVFVSEASQACVLLGSIDSEEDRSALVAVLRAELRNSDGKYTDKQLTALQKTCDDIVSKSLKDSRLATTPEWFIPWFELEMNEMTTLGEGGFGCVFKTKWLYSEVVVKKLEIADKDAADADKKREMRQMFEREVDIWFGLSHPHVVRLFGACHVGRPFFVCELAPNGTLVEYLRKHPDKLWTKLREAALGVQYLHARGIVHGDLKGNNILIGSDGKAMVTDFGLSGVFGDDSKEVVLSGAWHWVAPECLLGEKPTFASDIYSLAMCIIEVLRVTNGDKYALPWGKLPNAAVKFHAAKLKKLPSRPRNCSDEAWTLIMRMCSSAPADRMLIMTVVDDLEKLEGLDVDLSYGGDQFASDIDTLREVSASVTNALAEMKTWLANSVIRSDWEGGVLEKIYQLMWDRLEHVATQMFPDGDDTVITKTAISDLSVLVKRSQMRTRAALGITGDIPLVKFTELALGGYALHRRLDKFMAAHTVPKDSIPLHDWTSACTTFMVVGVSPPPTCSEEGCSANEEIGATQE